MPSDWGSPIESEANFGVAAIATFPSCTLAIYLTVSYGVVVSIVFCRHRWGGGGW